MNNYFIEPEINISSRKKQPASYLRKVITIDKDIKHAKAIFSACGIYKAYINGSAVDNQVFLPGFTYYTKRLQFQEYDITASLCKGKNSICAILGDGWYRGRIGISNNKNFYGKKTKILCIIDIEYADGGKERIVTDNSWKATQDGPIRYNDLKGGECYDATKEISGWLRTDYDDTAWHYAQSSSYNAKLVPSEGELILEHEFFVPEVIITPDKSIVLDFKQNIFGYVWFRVEGKRGDKVILTHGETLDENGNFTLKNLILEGSFTSSKRLQVIEYILKDGIQEYKPIFSAQGFQYVKLEGWTQEVQPENFKAIAVYSNMEEEGFFECSDPLINKLVSNVKWSMKSNFLDIPTDCPTRERAGWTGDISIFAETACYLMNTEVFLKKWLKDVMLQQYNNGKIPSIVPRVMKYSYFIDGSAGWGDVVATVPYTLYKMYNDKDVLELMYDCIVKWVEFCRKRARKRHLFNIFKFVKQRKYIIDTGYHWGEWLEPGHKMLKDVVKNFIKGDEEVATAMFASSTKILSEIAEILGKQEDKEKYNELYENIKAAYCNEFIKDGNIKSKRQCQYVRPLALNLVSGEVALKLADKLNTLVIENDYKIGTGFLTNALITKVLTDYGYKDTAFNLLKNTKQPGWLYSITKGASTIWENWNGVDEAGIPTDSLNHYAPGGIVGWLFNSVAGIRPIKPGFKEIEIKPIIGGDLTFAKCKYQSATGEIISQWEIDNQDFILNIQVPEKSVVHLPNGVIHKVNAGTHSFKCKVQV